MLEALIHFSLRQRLLTFLVALFITGWGAVSYSKLPIDAFPDVAPVQMLCCYAGSGIDARGIGKSRYRTN